MARNWQYPRWRRLLMQLAMWGILGATVGLAALVNRHQMKKRSVALGDPIICASIRLQLPRNAVPEMSFRRPGFLNADFPEHFPNERRLFVTVSPPASLGVLNRLLEKEPDIDHEDGVPFGTDGSIGQIYVHAGSMNGRAGPQSFIEVVATAHLKDGPQVTIRSQRIGAGEDLQTLAETDLDMVKAIAATVTQVAETAGM